jgi:hypothetical protein
MHNYSTTLVKILTLAGVLLFSTPFVVADTGGTISFLDGTDNPAFATTTGRATGSCQSDGCTVNIAAPQGFTWSGALLVDVWLNPDTTNVKDVLCGDIYGFTGHCTFSPHMVTLQFVAEGQVPLGTFASGIELENGILAQAGNIYWMNSNLVQITDSLTLESRLAAVPEPSSLVILAGLFGFGLVMTRRRQNSALCNRR